MPYKDYNNNFKVDLSEDKPVLQLDLQLKPMSEAPKDGSAVLCLVRHDDTKTFDADHGGLTPYGAWLDGARSNWKINTKDVTGLVCGDAL